MIRKYIENTLLLTLVLYLFSACNDKYYEDGGLANPNYNGSMLNFLESHPKFDTVARIVKLAGLENEFTQSDFTFFALTDESVKQAILSINRSLRSQGTDTITVLDEIEPLIWKKSLQGLMFKGVNTMKDYYQVDLTNKSLYPGQYYKAYNGKIVNIGVVFDNANGIQYAGARRIYFSTIVDYNRMTSWISTPVQTHDIKPKNGIVHVLLSGSSVSYSGIVPNLFIDVLSTR